MAPTPAPLPGRAAPPQGDVELLERLSAARADLLAQVGRRIVGQQDVLDGILTAVFSGGHALLLGVPGLAKTLMVQTVAQALELKFSRIQFTPDLMPSDITGTEIIEEDQSTGKRGFRFVRGPVFANIVLADEVNRTPPKTQAALLQAMQEHQVTAAGQTHPLPAPFFVLATQNPIEQEGTYPTPRAPNPCPPGAGTGGGDAGADVTPGGCRSARVHQGVRFLGRGPPRVAVSGPRRQGASGARRPAHARRGRPPRRGPERAYAPAGHQLRSRGGGAQRSGHRGRTPHDRPVDRTVTPRWLIAGLVGLAACSGGGAFFRPGPLATGTWGGDNAGLIASDTSAHVHIGCTLGNVHQAIVIDPGGRFDVPGVYNVTAYPVYRRPDHPARFTGWTDGRMMSLTVTLTDTAVTLGPVQLVFGRDPQMGPCPICRRPGG